MIFLTRMSAQGLAGEYLGTSAHIHGSGIEIVHPMRDGIIDHLVDGSLVVGQAHHTKAQQRNLLA